MELVCPKDGPLIEEDRELALQDLRCLAAVFLQFDLPILLCGNA
ncbi:hypothetical protein [Mesorhizobium abyssinicae]